jgi:hypothetical protein
MMDKIKKWFTGHYDHRVQTLDDIIKHFKLECSTTTLFRALDRRGFHKHVPEMKEWIPPKTKEERFGFAKKHKTKTKRFWRRGIYTNESTFNTRILRRLKIWRKKGERQRLDCIQFKFHSGRQSVSAWAAIGYNFKSKLVIITKQLDQKGFNQKAYERQILRGELANIARAKKMGKGHSEFFCVEDNSKVHGKKTTRGNKGLCNAARLECGIYSIDWPAKSPDLNPIEHCWRFIKQRLRNRKPHGGWTLPQLIEAIHDIWDNELTVDYLNKWIDTMPDRIKEVIARKGGPTRW